LFPLLLQHCPSLSGKHKSLRKIRGEWLGYNDNRLRFTYEIRRVDGKKLRRLVEFIDNIPGMDDVSFEYGSVDPLVHGFCVSTESCLLGKFADERYDNAEAPLNAFLARYSRYFDVDEAAEIRQAWRDAQAELFRESAEENSMKE
jgi:hypothetical protein